MSFNPRLEKLHEQYEAWCWFFGEMDQVLAKLVFGGCWYEKSRVVATAHGPTQEIAMDRVLDAWDNMPAQDKEEIILKVFLGRVHVA